MSYIPFFDMESYIFSIHSLSQTETLGALLGENAEAGDMYCLNGDLGAGKTTLTQFIAKSLDLEGDHYVSSPSFAILHEYPGKVPLYHMDFYRLHDSDDVIGLGFEEYFYKDGLCVIEWSERAADILPDELLTITVTLVDNSKRNVEIVASSKYLPLLEKIKLTFSRN